MNCDRCELTVDRRYSIGAWDLCDTCVDAFDDWVRAGVPCTHLCLGTCCYPEDETE